MLRVITSTASHPQIEMYSSLLCFSRACTNRLASFRPRSSVATAATTPSSSNPKQRHSKISNLSARERRKRRLMMLDKTGPDLNYFIARATSAHRSPFPSTSVDNTVPYLSPEDLRGDGRKVYLETYGCQMNVSDMEIVRAVLKRSGYVETTDQDAADVTLLMTCAVREGAERKVFRRLRAISGHRRNRAGKSLTIGVLGCMAERLKERLLELDKSVDLVVGPDAYRDLPRLLAITRSGQAAVNVLLSLDETYADVAPVRRDPNSVTAFVSIMRGCDNLCTYCIVPFTRGRERSRPLESIVHEVKKLSEQGVREVTLLGQNVNSYRDYSAPSRFDSPDPSELAAGFRTVYRPKTGGRHFGDLLRAVAAVDPEMRVRFTSPHPKDFSDDVLFAIRDLPNVTTKLHMPAQSGNDEILKAMGRGYTRQAYLQLVQHIRRVIPDVCLTSDFISGFCGETESAHEDTLSLMERVKYNFAFCFAYSMRQKTRAYRRLIDDVPQKVKNRRASEVYRAFQVEARKRNAEKVGSLELVLVEGRSKRSADDMQGLNDGGTRVIVPNVQPVKSDVENDKNERSLRPGDYVLVRVTDYTSHILKATPIRRTTLTKWATHVL